MVLNKILQRPVDSSCFTVTLCDHGDSFVTRSEAKRLLNNLERFQEVILDFKGVKGVGQGFADEVFRVWPLHHPGVVMSPINMIEAVAFMVQRARVHLI